jgi:DNA-binding SARP family transcriptional activator
MLGPLAVFRNGVSLELPASRKARALLGYLALASRPVGRAQLCELLWDIPNDPRAELRWCLSKLRTILDEPKRRRVVGRDDTVSLALDDCFVDAAIVASAGGRSREELDTGRLRALASLFEGEFLAGLEVDRSLHFQTWLNAQRRRFKSMQTELLDRLARALPHGSEEAIRVLEKWLEIAPFDERAHLTLLEALAGRGKIEDAERHLATAARLFESEQLDFAGIRRAWGALKQQRRSPAPRPIISASPQVEAIAPKEPQAAGPRRASLAVMPFGGEGPLPGGLTHDIITRLAKLRSLFIIAEGSVFALAEQSISPDEAGRKLAVDYIASGSVRPGGGRIVVSVELVEAATARIVWAETLSQKLDNTFDVLDEIGNKIVASIANEIELAERNRAILKPPNSLDAWEAYHRGLWHMYRFTQAENDLARHFFEMAIGQDPTFARAYASLSFTHWQNAFQRWGERIAEADSAYDAAGRSLMADDHDPAAHWAMGRALWLRGRADESLLELERVVDLSPNFALGHYSLSFVHSQSGDPKAAIGSSDHSRQLSPFDPLLFGMLGTRAMAHVRLGQFAEAAEWALKAAARPNAHVIILAIAAHCLALAGRLEEGRAFAATIHRTLPSYSVEDFLTTFQFAPEAQSLFREAAKHIGLG